VSYAGVGLTNISEIHKLGLDNWIPVSGPAIQIIGETKSFGNKKNCTNLVKGAKAPNGTYFAYQGRIHISLWGVGGGVVLGFLSPRHGHTSQD
jgi:hypothetical protein